MSNRLQEVEMCELRKEFEEICYKNKWNINKYPERYGLGNVYVDDFVNGAWWMFQELKDV